MYSKAKAIEHIKENKLHLRSRKREIVDKRHYMAYYLREVHELTVTSIARILNQNHTTVLYALKKIPFIKHDPQFLHNTEAEKILFPIKPNLQDEVNSVNCMDWPKSLRTLQNQFSKSHGIN